MKKKIILPALAVTVLGLGVLGITQAQAATDKEPVSNLVDMIASKFNLNKADVQGVFDQFHSQQEQKRVDMVTSKLDQAVKDGKITSAQKQAILDKMKEMRDNFDPKSFKDMTPEQRKESTDQRKSDLESWAKSQGLDLAKLKGLIGFPGMRGHHFGQMMHQ